MLKIILAGIVLIFVVFIGIVIGLAVAIGVLFEIFLKGWTGARS